MPFLGTIQAALLAFLNAGTTAATEECPLVVAERAIQGRRGLSFETRRFKALRSIPGRFGGQRVVVHRKGKAWFDPLKDLTKDGADYTSNLQIIPELLGPKGAAFFGFENLPDGTMTLPDIQELNGAIQAFNKDLPTGDPRRIEIDFFETEKGFVRAIDLVRNFGETSKVPCSTRGRSYLHDVSSHGLMGFFLDNSLVTVARNRANLLLRFKREFPNLVPPARGTLPVDQKRHQRLWDHYEKTVAQKISEFGGDIDSMGMSTFTFIPDDMRSSRFPTLPDQLRSPDGSETAPWNGVGPALGEGNLKLVTCPIEDIFADNRPVQDLWKNFLINEIHESAVTGSPGLGQRSYGLALTLPYDWVTETRAMNTYREGSPATRRLSSSRTGTIVLHRLRHLNQLARR